jgi:hypothetical protein
MVVVLSNMPPAGAFNLANALPPEPAKAEKEPPAPPTPPAPPLTVIWLPVIEILPVLA